MTSVSTDKRIRGSGARLGAPAGSLPAGEDLEFALDGQGLTLTGGVPVTAWQLPFSALYSPRAKHVGEYVEITGWVSGTHFVLTIPSGSLEGGTAEELVALVLSHPLSSGPGDDDGEQHTRTRDARSRRIAWMVASAIVVAAVVIAVIVALVLRSSPSTTTSAATKTHDRHLAASMNLRQGDVPSTWGHDSPTTSPLSGLLGTAPSSKETAQETKTYNTVVSEFQHCMGESNANDRIFGTAGVYPVAQAASAPFGTVIGSNLIEVGSVTQIYASARSVNGDLAQMRKSAFSSCFAQTMGRLVVVGADPSQANATPSVVVEKPRTELGAYIAGATATLQYPTSAGTVPIEVGTSIVISGRYEQTIYTFASPGVFPAVQRQQIESLLAARLAGISGTTTA